MILLESLELPGADTDALASQARAEVAQIGELIDDVLFLSELESGRAVVSLGSTRALPVLDEIVAARAERSANAGVALRVDCPPELELPLRPRMLETIAANLVDNALRYAGTGASFTIAARDEGGAVVLRGRTQGTACRTTTCPASSSASSARTVRAPHTAPGSAWRSSSTSLRRQAVPRRRGRCPAVAWRFAASSLRSHTCNQIVTGRSPPRRPATVRARRHSRAMGRLASAAALACALLLAAGCGGDGGSQTILADGSSTVGPFTTRAAENFKQENPDVEVTVGISGTGGGFERFCADETDLSNASREIEEDEQQLCADAGVEYVELPVANDALTVVVNSQNDWATCLTVEQLKAIWEPGSTVDNWQDLDPRFPDEPLRLYGPGTDSGTFDYFTDVIVGEEGESRTDYQASEDDNVIIEGVKGDAGALGYFGFSYYEQNQDTVKAVAVDNGSGCVAPSVETAQDGTYAPLSRPLFVYAKTSSLERAEVAEFLTYVLDNGAEIADQADFVPLTPTQLAAAKAKLQAALNA